jgi:hypothetical protein
MTDGYEEIYRSMIDSASGSAATERAATNDERDDQPRPLKPVMSDLTSAGRAS